jgi:thiamine pyrophosphokinase
MSPDIIAGDLDSIHPHVREDYEAAGSVVLQDKDENRHDLDKALDVVLSKDESPADVTVLVLGAFGGRFDHEVAALQVLYRHSATFGRLLLVGNETLAELLLPGEHEIVPNKDVEHGGHCGLLPIGVPVASITTTGLRWNLSAHSLSFGERGLVSSSNIIDDNVIRVHTSDPVVWTTEHWF